MKSEIQRIKRALAGENATSPTSRMVKIANGRIFAYGGTFCLSVPCALDLDVGFLPDPILSFYELQREGEVITVSDNHLKITAGNRSVKVPCIPGSDVPILDVLRAPINATLEMENIRRALTFVDVMDDLGQLHGISFSDGCLHAGTSKRIFTGASGLPEDVPAFRLPVASAEALLKVDSPVTTVFVDRESIRFDFEDGTRLVSRTLVDYWPKASMRIFEKEGVGVCFSEEAVKEIGKTRAHSWILHSYGAALHRGDGSEGEIVEAVTGVEEAFCIHHTSLCLMLELGSPLTVADTVLMTTGENFAAAVALLRN